MSKAVDQDDTDMVTGRHHRTGRRAAEGFVQAGGKGYIKILARLHQAMVFDWYFEIGSRHGGSLRHSRSKTVAVDPEFRLKRDVMAGKPQLHMFQQTSDDFFADNHLARMDARLSFSFLDGMHLFEYLLRDFMNAEDCSLPEGVIAMHDCCPFDLEMTTRDVEAGLAQGDWTGDVWKLIPILREYRPDLKLTVLDCAPTGLVLVSGLKPGDRRLRDAYDDIIARYTDMTLEDFGVERFFGEFEFTNAMQFAAEGFPLFRPVAVDAAGGNA